MPVALDGWMRQMDVILPSNRHRTKNTSPTVRQVQGYSEFQQNWKYKFKVQEKTPDSFAH